MQLKKQIFYEYLKQFSKKFYVFVILSKILTRQLSQFFLYIPQMYSIYNENYNE